MDYRKWVQQLDTTNNNSTSTERAAILWLVWVTWRSHSSRGNRGSFAWGMKHTTYLHLVLTLRRVEGVIPIPPPYSTCQHNGHVTISGLSEHAVKIKCWPIMERQRSVLPAGQVLESAKWSARWTRNLCASLQRSSSWHVSKGCLVSSCQYVSLLVVHALIPQAIRC